VLGRAAAVFHSEFCPLSSEFTMSIASAARRVARQLKASGRKVVFAESCTGGLVSGSLTRIAGISNFHCGGMVVYRNETKTAYLDIPAKMLIRPGPVSAEVAALMARKVLNKTPEADLALSVTGHLGPNAPPKLDGRVYTAIVWRESNAHRPSLPAAHSLQCRRGDSRVARQRWVVEQVLNLLADELEGAND
jgi:PncC family amidohydrolase